MQAATASQRETVLRSAKFPRTTAVVPYTATRRIVADFLPKHEKGFVDFDAAAARIEAQHRREADGWQQDELKRNIDALAAFKAAFRAKRLAKMKFTTGPTDLSMAIDGVRLNTRLDAGLLEVGPDGEGYTGGLIMFLAGGDAGRKNVDERAKIAAALVHWNLQEMGGNFEPLPRLCLSFDVFGGAITKAPTAIDRLRANVRSSCREAASNWDSVEPPPSYDGPDWR